MVTEKENLHLKVRVINPYVTGDIKLSDVYLIHPMRYAPANGEINLGFMGHKMKLDVFVPTGKDQRCHG